MPASPTSASLDATIPAAERLADIKRQVFRMSVGTVLSTLAEVATAAATENDPATAAEAYGCAARLAAFHRRQDDAERCRRQARSWLEFCDQGTTGTQLSCYEISVLVYLGDVNRALALSGELFQDPSFHRLPLPARLGVVTDLVIGLGEQHGARVALEQFRRLRARALPKLDEFSQAKITLLHLSLAVRSLLHVQPLFEQELTPKSPAGPWVQEVLIDLADMLREIDGHLPTLLQLHGRTLAVALEAAQLIGRHAGLHKPPEVPGLLALRNGPPSESPFSAWIAAQWSACAALLEGRPRAALQAIEQCRRQFGEPHEVGKVAYLESRAWLAVGDHRTALARYQVHVLEARSQLSPSTQEVQSLWAPPTICETGEPNPTASHLPPPLARAVEHVKRQQRLDLKVTELVRVSGRSERWLRAAFQQHLGCTPKDFLVNTRLELARGLLLRGCVPHGGLSGLASSIGFTNTGRFAKAYIARFHEPPKETLRLALHSGSH